jgi:hypothetical protein
MGTYFLNRLYDRDPFPTPIEVEKEEPAEPKPTMVKKVGSAALERLQKKMKQARKEYAEGSDSSGTGHRQTKPKAR